VNFGGIYNFGELGASSLATAFGVINAPSFSAVQAYGLGIPQVFIQGVGNPHDFVQHEHSGLLRAGFMARSQ